MGLMHMRRNAVWIFCLGLLAVFGLVGCGGAGNGPYRGDTPFVGSYSGTWTMANGDSGSMFLTVAGNAQLMGTYVDTTTNETGKVQGNTQQDGRFWADLIADGSGVKTH